MTPTTWTCVRCVTTIEPFEFTVGDDTLPDLTSEAEAWVSAFDRRGGRLCADCATQAEKWRDEARCVRCGADEPRDWTEFSDLEWLRVSADGGVCPECWVPADAEAEADAMDTLAPLIAKHDLAWSDELVARNGEALRNLERLRRAHEPDDF